MAPVTTEIFIANEVAREQLDPGRLAPSVEPTVPYRMQSLVKRPMFWRTAEALAIAIVFCMMIGVSIHRLPPSGRASLPSESLEQRNASRPARPTANVLGLSQQPVVSRNAHQSPDGGEADIVAEDAVISHQERAGELPSQAAKKPVSRNVQVQILPPKNTTLKPGVRFTFGRDTDMLAAVTVVRYGDDVKMWSRIPKKAGLDRLEQ